MITLTHYLTVAAALFCLGAYGALTRRNVIGVLISLEIMLNAVNINLVAFSRFVTPSAPIGQIFTIFVIAVAAAMAAIGLALILAVYRSGRSIEVDKMNLMKW